MAIGMKTLYFVSIPGLLSSLALYIAINTFFALSPSGAYLRLDVTEDKRYSLSQETGTILNRIEEPIEFHFFFSEQLRQNIPVYASYGQRVKDLLIEIASASNGKVHFVEHNPLSFSEEEDLAIKFGIQGIPLDQGEELVYFGLAVINSVDKTEIIPFFQPERERLLEYDLVKIIYSLTNFEPVKVGVLSSLPVMGDMQAAMQGGLLVPWAVGARLRDSFDIVNLPETIEELPQDLDVLIVIHPKQVSEQLIYGVEQFLFHGGRAIFFIDPKAESDTYLKTNEAISSSNSFNRLFNNWGIGLSTEQLVADRSLALKINAGSVSRPIPAKYVLWLGITDKHLAVDSPITSQLKVVNLASPGYISNFSESSLTITPLIQSTQNSSVIALEKARSIRPDILELLNGFVPDDNVYTLAARFSGPATSAFYGKRPLPADGKIQNGLETTNEHHLAQSQSSINFVLVADTDLLADRFWTQERQFYGRTIDEQIADNANFLINAVEHLSGSEEMLNLRSRGVSQRSFETISEIKQQAEQTLQVQRNQLLSTLQETQKEITSIEEISSVKDPVTGDLKVAVSLTDEQRNEIQLLRNKVISIRKELRLVQRGLREDIEKLESMLLFVNIGLLPCLFLLALVFWGMRRVVSVKHSNRSRRELT